MARQLNHPPQMLQNVEFSNNPELSRLYDVAQNNLDFENFPNDPDVPDNPDFPDEPDFPDFPDLPDRAFSPPPVFVAFFSVICSIMLLFAIATVCRAVDPLKLRRRRQQEHTIQNDASENSTRETIVSGMSPFTLPESCSQASPSLTRPHRVAKHDSTQASIRQYDDENTNTNTSAGYNNFMRRYRDEEWMHAGSPSGTSGSRRTGNKWSQVAPSAIAEQRDARRDKHVQAWVAGSHEARRSSGVDETGWKQTASPQSPRANPGSLEPLASSSDSSASIQTHGVGRNLRYHPPHCPICFEPLNGKKDHAFLPCMHAFHLDCLSSWAVKSKNRVCPVCSINGSAIR